MAKHGQLSRTHRGTGAKTVLVDTSLLVQLQKRAEYSSPVREALMPYRFKGASSYSALEFKRTWVQYLAYIHSICRRSGVGNVNDVQSAVNRLHSNRHQQRRVQSCFDAISKFLESDQKAISGRAQLARLRAHCKHAVLTSFESLQQLTTHQFKGTGCIRAAEAPSEKRGGALDVTVRSCKPTDIRCCVHRFFESNRATFASIADFVERAETTSGELKKMRDHIRKAEKDPRHLCDNKHCRRLADALIAVDGKDMDVFAANNDAEWVPIASTMDKELLNPVTGTRREPKSCSSSER